MTGRIDPDVQEKLDLELQALDARLDAIDLAIAALQSAAVKPHSHAQYSLTTHTHSVASDTTAPPVPTGLTATPGNAQISLNWADSTAADFASYKVYGATAAAGPFALVTTRTTSDYVRTGLVNGTAYWYKVSAVDTAGNESAQTAAATATPQAVVVPPPDSTPIPGAIQVTPTTTSVIAGAAAGATLQFAAGTYKRLTVAPKTGQKYIANPGAILDGENATQFAFRGTGDPVANDVTIKGFEIKNYTPPEAPGWSEGAITSKWYGNQGGGSGWIVENCHVHHNRGAGVMLTDRGVVRSCNVHHNYSIGVKLYWAPTSGLVELNEIAYNNFDGNDDYNETGGTKFAWTKNLVVKGNNAHHNHGPGLWTDIDNVNSLFEENLCEDNSGPGIFHEISYSAMIRKNIVRRCGWFNRGWLWEGGIMVAASQDVVVEDNVIEDCFNGITMIEQVRGSGAMGTWILKNVTAQRNKVTRSGITGAVQDHNDPAIYTAARAIKFLDNDYIGGSFSWNGSPKTWTEWKAAGHDLTGSYV